jgi:selenide,water dikinase
LDEHFGMTSSPRLTDLAHGGGCGCKLAPSVLSEILAKMPAAQGLKDLLVESETADDAAVYMINDRQALIATTDFFMPIVDDPFDFGRIAAANALSDVYAMGGNPILALALVGMPVGKLPVEIVQPILAGGASVCAEAGIPVAGAFHRCARADLWAGRAWDCKSASCDAEQHDSGR